jgi:hypothetical protein
MMGKGIFDFIMGSKQGQSGNIFFAMFGAVALVGAIGAASMTVMKGPVRTMDTVTKRTIAENNMMASSKLAVMGAVNGANAGDCDSDGFVEPVPYVTGASAPFPVGGGYLPSTIGASQQDPWQGRYGYCVWDHGTATADVGCEVSAGVSNRLAGANQSDLISLAVISAGPDRVFQTSCRTAADADAAGNTNGIIGDTDAEDILVRTTGSDDIIHSYTYAEANTAGEGLWNLKSGDSDTAQIQKNLEVKDAGGNVQFSLDSDTGVGEFSALKVDNIYSKTLNGTVMMQSPIRALGVPGIDPPVAGSGGGGGGGGDDLGNHTATQDLAMGAFDIKNLDNVLFNGIAGNPPVYGGGAAGGGGGGGGSADNLGDHTATEALDMATFNIINAGTVTATAYLHSSDRNLKDQIQAITDPFGLLDAVHGMHYVWKKDGKAAYGVIAQDVETVMPEAVATGEDGFKAVEYDQLIAPMIEAIKQLKAENQKLREDIDALKTSR